MKPAFSDEVMLAGWKESHNSGATVTFWLVDSDQLAAFKAMTVKKGNTAGQRLAMVLVEIGDDEQPIAPPEPKEKTGPLCLLAVRWCQERSFQLWLAEHFSEHPGGTDELNAGIRLKCVLGIESRKELDHNPEAADKFHRLIRIPYMQHLEGK